MSGTETATSPRRWAVHLVALNGHRRGSTAAGRRARSRAVERGDPHPRGSASEHHRVADAAQYQTVSPQQSDADSHVGSTLSRAERRLRAQPRLPAFRAHARVRMQTFFRPSRVLPVRELNTAADNPPRRRSGSLSLQTSVHAAARTSGIPLRHRRGITVVRETRRAVGFSLRPTPAPRFFVPLRASWHDVEVPGFYMNT